MSNCSSFRLHSSKSENDCHDHDHDIPVVIQSNNNSHDERKEQEDGSRNSIIETFLSNIQASFRDEILPQIYNDGVPIPIRTDTAAAVAVPSDTTKPLIVLLGVSGGCDSVALFHSVMQLCKPVIKQFDLTDDDANSNEEGKPSQEKNLFEFHLGSRCVDGGIMHGCNSNGVHMLLCQLHVVHFDHCQRGNESMGDRLFTEELCEENGVAIHTYYWNDEECDFVEDGNGNASNQSSDKFSQERARDWRRRKSLELMNALMGDDCIRDDVVCDQQQKRRGVIFTAHHKDDSEETILLKLLRGVHITNISGLESVRAANESGNSNIGTTYFAKPMLGVRKFDIQRYLTCQGFTWREDESNQTDKYLRNRVRNELIPLVSDLMGGQRVLEARLNNIQEQSQRVKDDITTRADEYFKSASARTIGQNENNNYFTIPRHEGSLDVVEEEALYRWVRARTRNTTTLSYEKMKSIAQQLSIYPNRREWKIDIGDRKEIERVGEVLILNDKNHIMNSEKNVSWSADTSWNIELLDNLDSIIENETPGVHIQVAMDVPVNDPDLNYSIRNISGNESLKFLPPWRKGKTEMKVKEFLRGQKIPLHRRKMAPFLCANVNGEDKIVAVFVEVTASSSTDKEGGRWIIHAAFDPESKDKHYLHQINLTRRKQ